MSKSSYSPEIILILSSKAVFWGISNNGELKNILSEIDNETLSADHCAFPAQIFFFGSDLSIVNGDTYYNS